MPDPDYRDALLRRPAPAPCDLAAIRARLEAINGPWALADGSRGFIPGLAVFEKDQNGRVVHETPIMGARRQEQYAADCAFIAAAPADIAALLAEVERLRALSDTRRARCAGKRDYAADQLATPTGNERDYAFWSGYREACQDMLDEEAPREI